MVVLWKRIGEERDAWSLPPHPHGPLRPQPQRRMHLGNIWSGLLAWLSARSQGGRMVLRLEDLDPGPVYPGPGAITVMRDLEWLGLTWDNEPGVSK